MKHYLGLLLCFVIIACQSKHTQSAENQTVSLDLKTLLPGKWETVAFKVNINTYQNTDSTFVLEVKGGEWEDKLQMRPIQTEYSARNRYQSNYHNLSDSLIRTERGIWNIFGDTLMLISPEATYQYKVNWQGEMVELRSVLDWDGDGQEDDEYIGIQKLVKEQN